MAQDFKPYVDPKTNMKELTLPPLILGAIMAVVLGAANTYLGLKAGMTVAAAFPAAVISMAVLRAFRGNILEENIARTTGAVGEALAAGAIFTIPAFIIVGAWDDMALFSANWFMATSLLMVGVSPGVLLIFTPHLHGRHFASFEAVAARKLSKQGRRSNWCWSALRPWE